MNRIRSAAVTAAVVGTTLAASFTTTAATATAAAPVSPRFLSAEEMPVSLTPWQADPVQKGLPDSGSWCTEGVTPRGRTWYRDFRTELDTEARQTITVAPTVAKAERLAAELRSSIETCLDRMKAQDPGLEGEAFYHGLVDVEDGAHVYSIDTSYPEVGSTSIGLYSIGRDGRAVTVVEWGQLGDLDGAPLEGFEETTASAVAKLY